MHRKIWLLVFVVLWLLVWQGVGLLAAPPQQAELANITFPTDGAVVRGVISVRGNAVHPSFDRFQVAYAQEPVVRNDQWITIGAERREQVVNGELVVWDTNAVPDGSYRLRLRVIRLDGNYSEVEVAQVVVANAQPTETPTPEDPDSPGGQGFQGLPTATPTALPPTPTIVIEVPVDDTPTPRPLTITQALPTPRPDTVSTLPIPTVVLDTAPLKAALLWGAGGMVMIFLTFGLLSALRLFLLGFFERRKR